MQFLGYLTIQKISLLTNLVEYCSRISTSSSLCIEAYLNPQTITTLPYTTSINLYFNDVVFELVYEGCMIGFHALPFSTRNCNIVPTNSIYGVFSESVMLHI